MHVEHQWTQNRIIEIIFCLGTNNNYELLQKEDISGQVTLVNSRHMVNRNISDTTQEIADTEFVTAHELPMMNMMVNKFV
jgi:hypothetical protein